MFFFKDKNTSNEPTAKDLAGHHCYKGDVLADGFVSPIVLPIDRLRELRGTDSVAVMADKCRIPTRELQLLLEYDYLEPNVRQLMSISHAYQVSIMWLLGYHAPKHNAAVNGDYAMLNAVSQRNEAEATVGRIKEKGAYRDFLIRTANKRVVKRNRIVANTAARIIAAQHVPLNEAELYLLRGQPVFIEYTNGLKEWGLVMAGTIRTLSEELDIDAVGVSYNAYQTPDTAITDF